MASLRSKEMRREDVNDGGDDEKEKQRQVEDVPKPEEAFVERKGRSLPYRRNMQCYQVSYAGKLPSPNLSRPSKVLAFDRYDLPGVGNQPRPNNPCTPANHRQKEKPGENALGGNRTKLRKRVKLGDDTVGNWQAGAYKPLERIGVGEDLLHDRFASVQSKVDLAVEIPPDDSTSGNNKHRREGHIAVDRAEPEIRVQQNQHGP